jgi:DNA polymerase-4
MGIDGRNVVPEHEAKSVGNEKTFMQDIMDLDNAKKELLALATKVASRIRREKITGKAVSLKVKYNDFRQITREAHLSEPTDDGFEIYSVVCNLLKKSEIGKRPVRLLGISLSQLSFVDAAGQLSLFSDDQSFQKRKELNVAIDSIHEKHGEKSVRPATLFY